MHENFDRELGAVITRLIQKENLSRIEAKNAFTRILKNEVTQMQQGAFLAALTAKGETEDEVAAGWEAIYNLDTNKAALNHQGPVVENSGTGMDTFKTFNISTAAAIIAAAGGIHMARHGARAITSVCGTVDMAEALGVDVECSANRVAESIDRAGIGLFNGMSPNIHPMALGRILSNINFGSTLNIAASLANPALPKIAVRGVYNRRMLLPVIKVMKAIGYQRAIVLYGAVDGTDKGMDEASVCGTTFCAELLENGDIKKFDFHPADYDMAHHEANLLSPDKNMDAEAKRFISLLRNGQDPARTDAALLNAGLIFYVSGKARSIKDGVNQATAALENGNAFNTLENWVIAQNRVPEKGLARLNRLANLN